MGLKIEPISTALGARILGLNLEYMISESDLSRLKDAFFKYHLLCIEETPLNSSNFLRFARLFGEPQMQLLRNRYDGKNPEVSILESTYKTEESKPDDLTKVRLSGWHTDDSYFEKPAKATKVPTTAP